MKKSQEFPMDKCSICLDETHSFKNCDCEVVCFLSDAIDAVLLGKSECFTKYNMSHLDMLYNLYFNPLLKDDCNLLIWENVWRKKRQNALYKQFNDLEPFLKPHSAYFKISNYMESIEKCVPDLVKCLNNSQNGSYKIWNGHIGLKKQQEKWTRYDYHRVEQQIKILWNIE